MKMKNHTILFNGKGKVPIIYLEKDILKENLQLHFQLTLLFLCHFLLAAVKYRDD